jgi:DNA polymerase-3 subunit gamma/tau
VSYLAIARKYRPATFDEIVGQEHVTRTLKNALEKGRIHHAFLFSGARGVGKTTAARALARALNCERGPTADPCGSCPSCTEVGIGNSPDLIEIDGASNNSVDDIRDLRETVRYAPTRGKWKIYLIDEVHMLSKGAFNALLKTLEEPPPHVVFIFATTESSRIPETILSRVQRFDFKRIPVAQVAERLRQITEREGVRISEVSLRLIARAGDGSMRDAQSLLDQAISYGAQGDARTVSDREVIDALGLIDRGWLLEMLAALVEGAPERGLAVIDRVYTHGFELSEFTAEMLDVLRNATLLRLSPAARQYLDVAPDEIDRLDALVKEVPVDSLGRAFAAMLDVHDDVARASRPRVVLEMAVARIASTRPAQPLSGLVSRLEDLERRLRQGGAAAPPSGLRGARSPRSPRSASETPAADDEGAPAPAPPPTFAEVDPWESFRVQVVKLGPNLARLAEGLVTVDADRVRITLRSAFALAEARRDAGREELRDLVRACFGPGVSLDLVAPPTGVLSQQDEWMHRVKQDPTFRRIVERLGAEVGSVIPLREEE